MVCQSELIPNTWFLSSVCPIVFGKLNQTRARPTTVKHFFFKTFVSNPPPPHFSYDLSVLKVWNILCVPFLWSNIRCFLPCWLTLSRDNITSFYFRGVWFRIFTLLQVIRAGRIECLWSEQWKWLIPVVGMESHSTRVQ